MAGSFSSDALVCDTPNYPVEECPQNWFKDIETVLLEDPNPAKTDGDVLTQDGRRLREGHQAVRALLEKLSLESPSSYKSIEMSLSAKRNAVSEQLEEKVRQNYEAFVALMAGVKQLSSQLALLQVLMSNTRRSLGQARQLLLESEHDLASLRQQRTILQRSRKGRCEHEALERKACVLAEPQISQERP